MENDKEKARELITGGYDLHVHTSPSAFARSLDGFEMVQEADALGMAGVVLKSHYEPTAIRATLINQYAGCKKVKAYGAISLNWPVGGLNPYAVENALRVGAKIIWMPTRDAKNSLRFGNMDGDFFNREGITVLAKDGGLLDCVYDIMDTVKRYGAILATGHLSPEESVLLCHEGRKRGVRMVLTHPEFCRTVISSEIQAELADLGVLIEKNWMNVDEGMVSIEQMAASIRRVGCHRAFLATDRGQIGRPHPAGEMLRFIEALLGQGFGEAQIRDLVCYVPKSIVD